MDDGIVGSVRVPPNFDPSSQDFNLTVPDPDGGWGFQTINMRYFNDYRINYFRAAIGNGAGFGASITLLLVLLILTKAEKRKSFIFLLNAICLFINTIRCLLICSRSTGGFLDPYTDLTGDTRLVTSGDFATLIATNIFGVMVAGLVYVSLSLQVWIVCVTTPALQRSIIMGATVTMACVAFATKLAAVYWNTKLTLAYESYDPINDLISVSYILQCISIWLFSCVFTYKLGYAILQRRRLNMPQFGPMQIIFIMGCQTMSIPAIFTTLQFMTDVPEMITHVLTVVCIFLPFSAIWAGVANDQSIASRNQRHMGNNVHGKSAASTLTDGSTLCGNSCQMSSWSDTKSKDPANFTATSTSHAYDTNVEDNCIRVDRKFGFSHDDAAGRV